MKILILGAAGKISHYLIEDLLAETDDDLVLFARNAHQRLSQYTDKRVTLFDGDFLDRFNVADALENVDVVYMNEGLIGKKMSLITEEMQKKQVKRLILASAGGIYDELPEPFNQWNERMVGNIMPAYRASAEVAEKSGLDYTILRMVWLYDQDGNEAYQLTAKGENFKGTQTTRQAAARLIMDILANPGNFKNQNLGVSEPNTDGEKPSFY